MMRSDSLATQAKQLPLLHTFWAFLCFISLDHIKLTYGHISFIHHLYPLPSLLERETHEGKTFVCFVLCSNPCAQKGVWHIVGAQQTLIK